MNQPLLKVRDISYTYHTKAGETPALSHISFSVSPGEFIAIVGPSGCGKSTFLDMLCSLLKPADGQILLNEKPLEESAASIGYMLQKDHLFEWRTIYDNVMLGLEIQKRITPKTRTRAEQLLTDYGLDNFRQSRPSQLSGGMRQRAALIRTLALEPELLLLDEPFSALDTLTKSAMHKWYLKVMEQIHLSTIFITHDIDEAILLSDRIYLLTGQPGSITAEIKIRESKPRREDFNLTPEFLEYKRQILEELGQPE